MEATKNKKMIVRGSPADAEAYRYAAREQGYVGDLDSWVSMPLMTRQEYEDGAAGGGGAMEVVQLGALRLIHALLRSGTLQLVAEHTGGHAPRMDADYPDPVDTVVGVPAVKEALDHLGSMDLGSLIEDVCGAFGAAAEARMHRRYRGGNCPQDCLSDVVWSVADLGGYSAAEAIRSMLFGAADLAAMEDDLAGA